MQRAIRYLDGGLWSADFAADPPAKLYRDHIEWLLIFFSKTATKWCFRAN